MTCWRVSKVMLGRDPGHKYFGWKKVGPFVFLHVLFLEEKQEADFHIYFSGWICKWHVTTLALQRQFWLRGICLFLILCFRLGEIYCDPDPVICPYIILIRFDGFDGSQCLKQHELPPESGTASNEPRVSGTRPPASTSAPFSPNPPKKRWTINHGTGEMQGLAFLLQNLVCGFHLKLDLFLDMLNHSPSWWVATLQSAVRIDTQSATRPVMSKVDFSHRFVSLQLVGFGHATLGKR